MPAADKYWIRQHDDADEDSGHDGTRSQVILRGLRCACH
jgi:hypothetical protein